MMNFDEAPEFKKDVKALAKRVPTLRSDIKRAKDRIIPSLYVIGDDMTQADLDEYRKQFFSNKKNTILPGSTEDVQIVKIRLDSDTIQYQNKLRLIFIAIKKDDLVTLIELYSKNDNQDNHDAKRLKKYL